MLLQPEYEHSGRSSKNAYYVVAVDVGRKGCNSEATIIKVTPQPQGDAIKSLVCIYSLQAEHLKSIYTATHPSRSAARHSMAEDMVERSRTRVTFV